MSNPEMLLIALQYLGNQGAIRLLVDKFDRTESTIWTSVHLICNLFRVQSDHIYFSPRNDLKRTAAKFF
jgi:hypothetical protein